MCPFLRVVVHVILAAAFVVQGHAGTRDIRVDGKPPADYVAERTGKSWAVVIGINDYERVRRLTYAAQDAK